MPSHLLPFQSFLDQVINTIQHDPQTIGLAAGGSWASAELDAYSDLDLVVVTTAKIAPDLDRMRAYADRLGTMLASFRGDHVGEPRLLIALYGPPVLHVDIKFLTLDEFFHRVENPVILWERAGQLTAVLDQSTAHYPGFDYQTTEDRFWIWMHYALLKIGRGEYFEALDFISFVRSMVIGPMLQLSQGALPRGVRRIETVLDADRLNRLRKTVATPDRDSLMASLTEIGQLYEELRDTLAPATLQKNTDAQLAVNAYRATL
ncbi:aminoglycoside 6-adenylyltransferase [Spirosoma knui]